jgi:hypothetical protein
MKLDSISADSAVRTQVLRPTRGAGVSFQAAYAGVYDERYAPTAQVSAPAHIVRAGETLSGIMRERLASLGAAPDGDALRQDVAQLALANNIRNPDRIYVGQRLEFAVFDAASGRNNPVVTGGFAAIGTDDDVLSPDDVAYIATAHEVTLPAHRQWGDSMLTDVVYAGAAGSSEVSPASPFTSAIAEDNDAAKPPVASLAAQVALYDQIAPVAPEQQVEPTRVVPDIIYKGIAGKVLDAMPLEPSTRTTLQRANAVVSGAATARTIGALTGLGGPLLTIAGLIWGIFSSRQIEAAPAEDAKPAGDTKVVADAK